MKVFVQQRLGSSRFPRKAMEEIGGLTITEHVLRRAANVAGKDNVFLLVPASDMNEFLWLDYQVLSFEGVEEWDLMGRFYMAVTQYAHMSEPVVRLTGDCPFVPESAIEEVAEMVAGCGHDYAESRSDPSTRPNGIDAQAFTPGLLCVAEAVTDLELDREDREHMTQTLTTICNDPCVLETLEGLYLDRIPPFRITVDHPEDLASLRGIWAALGGKHPTLFDLDRLYSERPDLFVLEDE